MSMNILTFLRLRNPVLNFHNFLSSRVLLSYKKNTVCDEALGSKATFSMSICDKVLRISRLLIMFYISKDAKCTIGSGQRLFYNLSFFIVILFHPFYFS